MLVRSLEAGTEPGARCRTTPGQIEGPFRPRRAPADADLDLTQVQGRKGRAEGTLVEVRGQVLDQDCQPMAGAVVEIWQANTWGRYDHERDAGNSNPLDPNFQGSGRVVSDEEGRYRFLTIKPGSYPADGRGWVRPPHIHFKVSRRGYHELTTQMYFAGEALNEPDLLLRDLSPEERSRVTVAFEPAAGLERGATTGSFAITLRRVV